MHRHSIWTAWSSPSFSLDLKRISEAVLGTDTSLGDRIAAGIDQDIAAVDASSFDLDSLVVSELLFRSKENLGGRFGHGHFIGRPHRRRDRSGYCCGRCIVIRSGQPGRLRASL